MTAYFTKTHLLSNAEIAEIILNQDHGYLFMKIFAPLYLFKCNCCGEIVQNAQVSKSDSSVCPIFEISNTFSKLWLKRGTNILFGVRMWFES